MAMSILKYFRPIKQTVDLPYPDGPLSENMPPSAVSSANAKVTDVLCIYQCQTPLPHTRAEGGERWGN